jgi:uncharacterized protein
VLAVEGKTVNFIGEAKATGQRQGVAALSRLQEIRDVLTRFGYRTGDAVLGVFSLTGFSPDLAAAAERDPAVVLVDLDRLYGAS